MKVLIILALVAAASCKPEERPKRNLYPASQYATGLSPLVQNGFVSNELQSSNYQALKASSSSLKSSSFAVPAFQQAYQPLVASYQSAYPAYQAAYAPTTYQAYQPANYLSYEQPSYYSAQAALPVQSQYYNAVPSQVQYVNQPEVVYSSPSLSSVQTVPSYISSGVAANTPWC